MPISIQCSSRLGNKATEHNKQIKTLPENSLRIQEKVLKTGRNVYRGFNIFKGTKSGQTIAKRNKSLCLLRTAEHHGTYLRPSVCISCKPNSTVLHTITDGQVDGWNRATKAQFSRQQAIILKKLEVIIVYRSAFVTYGNEIELKRVQFPGRDGDLNRVSNLSFFFLIRVSIYQFLS